MTSDRVPPQPILLVEDDPGLTRLFALVVARARIPNPVVTVGCGDDALAFLGAAGAHPPAVVLLDMGLPDIDGVSLLALIRDMFDQAALPIVVLSGSVETSTVERAIAAGADRFLSKPVGIDELIATLATFGVGAAYEAAS